MSSRSSGVTKVLHIRALISWVMRLSLRLVLASSSSCFSWASESRLSMIWAMMATEALASAALASKRSKKRSSLPIIRLKVFQSIKLTLR